MRLLILNPIWTGSADFLCIDPSFNLSIIIGIISLWKSCGKLGIFFPYLWIRLGLFEKTLVGRGIAHPTTKLNFEFGKKFFGDDMFRDKTG